MISKFLRIVIKADPGPAQRARARPFEKQIDCITRLSFDYVVHVNMQCLQKVFYSLLSLRKDRAYVKSYQNYPDTKKFHRTGTAPPVLKLLDPPLFYV